MGYIANESEYRHRIIDKLVEEVKEFKESASMEELADLLEVVDHIYDAFGFVRKEVREIKNQKKRKKEDLKPGTFYSALRWTLHRSRYFKALNFASLSPVHF